MTEVPERVTSRLRSAGFPEDKLGSIEKLLSVERASQLFDKLSEMLEGLNPGSQLSAEAPFTHAAAFCRGETLRAR